MPGTEVVIQGRHLGRTFGQGATATVALRDVSLDLFAGQFVLLMGPSGAGKSTLLAVLSGLLRPTTGRVLTLGRDLWGMSEPDREQFRLQHTGFIFQAPHLFPMLTAGQQLEIVLRWRDEMPPRQARQRAREMLHLLHLEDKQGLYPDALSGGEKQRVAVGRALVRTPVACFADEPTSQLDWGHGEQIVRLLRDAARQDGAMVLVVSHDARLVPFADAVYTLTDGRMVSGHE